MKRVLSFSLIILALLGFAAWLYVGKQTATYQNQTLNDQKPDAVFYDVTATRMDKNGQVDSMISSSQVTHFQQTDTTQFEHPKAIFFKEGTSAWHITADQGKAHSGIDHIDLKGHVRIHQPAGKHNHDLNVSTDALTINPPQQVAETQQPVTILQPGSTIHSVGMRFYLKQGRVELLSKAQGRFSKG